MNHYLEKLEYNKILNNLANYAITFLGKDLCFNLLPSNSQDEVEEMLEETEESVNLMARCNTPPLTELSDNTANLKILESHSTLSAKSILDVTRVLQISNDLKNYFQVDYINQEEYSILQDTFSKLYTNNSIIEKLHYR